MTTSDLPSWYEDNLPARERKGRGHFSTPPQLVEQILDACHYTPDHDLSQLRVLDPACGSGNFLAQAAARLLTYGQQANLTERAQARLLQHNIWGIDLDPISCFLAEMQLQHTFSLYTQSKQPGQPNQGQKKKRPYFPRRLHIHLADGLAFPWQTSVNVDLFLANPPYLASKNTDLSSYLSGHQDERGKHGGPGGQWKQADSYLLFLRLALQIVRPNGWIGLVLPDPLLARTNGTSERQRLLAETTVHHLWHLSTVFAADVGAVAIVAQKRLPTRLHQIAWKRGQWLHPTTKNGRNEAIRAARQAQIPMLITRENTIAQAILRNQPQAELRYLLSEIDGTLIEDLHRNNLASITNGTSLLAPLGAYVLIRRGEEIAKDSRYLSMIRPAENRDDGKSGWYPVLRGGVDIRAYSQPVASCWLPDYAIGKPLARYQVPKLLVIKSVGRLQATLDLQGHVVLQTLYLLQLQKERPALWEGDIQADGEDEDTLYFLLALLNSRILQEYIYVLYTAYKLVQPQIEQHVLMNLPIPITATQMEKRRIVQFARQLMHTCSGILPTLELKEHHATLSALHTLYNELYEKQEHAINALYQRALSGKGDKKITQF
jgi:hypothetical protein